MLNNVLWSVANSLRNYYFSDKTKPEQPEHVLGKLNNQDHLLPKVAGHLKVWSAKTFLAEY